MIGFVPVLLAQEIYEGKMISIYRELPYKRHITQDLTEETYVNLDEISQFLRTLLHRSSMDAFQGNAQGLMNTLHFIRHIYTSVTSGLHKLQEFMPRSLIRFYEKISQLENQLATNKANYNYNETVVAEIEGMEIFMEDVREKILVFWEERPEIYIRLPAKLHRRVPNLFSSDAYLPYSMGIKALPIWIDPMIINLMNETRKTEQTKEQMLTHRAKYHKYLMAITRAKHGVSTEIVTMIVEYMPITIVFDLLETVSPSQLAATDCEKIRSGDSTILYIR